MAVVKPTPHPVKWLGSPLPGRRNCRLGSSWALMLNQLRIILNNCCSLLQKLLSQQHDRLHRLALVVKMHFTHQFFDQGNASSVQLSRF